jgi:hypothetical protein
MVGHCAVELSAGKQLYGVCCCSAFSAAARCMWQFRVPPVQSAAISRVEAHEGLRMWEHAVQAKVGGQVRSATCAMTCCWSCLSFVPVRPPTSIVLLASPGASTAPLGIYKCAASLLVRLTGCAGWLLFDACVVVYAGAGGWAGEVSNMACCCCLWCLSFVPVHPPTSIVLLAYPEASTAPLGISKCAASLLVRPTGCVVVYAGAGGWAGEVSNMACCCCLWCLSFVPVHSPTSIVLLAFSGASTAPLGISKCAASLLVRPHGVQAGCYLMHVL